MNKPLTKLRPLSFLWIVLAALSLKPYFSTAQTCVELGTISVSNLTQPVGASCAAPLQWSASLVTITPKAPYKLMSRDSTILGGFVLNQPIPAPTTVKIVYAAKYYLLNPNLQVGPTCYDTLRITFKDFTPPVFSNVPAAVTVACALPPSITPTVTDNCGNPITVTVFDNSIPNKCTGNVITRTWTATDKYGNSSTASQLLTIQADVTAPTFTTPSNNLMVSCDATTQSAVTTWLNAHGGAVASDGCGGAITWTQSPALPNLSTGCAGIPANVAITFTATDECGNKASTTANIIVTDNVAPVIATTPQSQIMACNASGNAAEFETWFSDAAGSAAHDACTADADLVVVTTIAGTPVTKTAAAAAWQAALTGTCDDNVTIGASIYNNVKGKLTIGFAYKDLCGNTTVVSNATFAITDNTTPNITTPAADLSVQCDNVNTTQALTDWYNNNGGAVAGGGCGTAVSFRTVPASLALVTAALVTSQGTSCGNTGNVQVSFFAKDACGNENPTATIAKFTILDTKGPVVTTPPNNVTVECAATNTAALSSFITNHASAVVSDGCGTAVWDSYTWKDANNTVGTNTLPIIPANNCTWFVDVTFKAKDECGNITDVTARFGIKDTTLPIFVSTPSNLTVQCDAVPAIATLTATDNCDASVNVTTAETTTKGAVSTNANFYNYVIIRTWVATDDCNNKQTTSQTITVEDTKKPTFTVPSDRTVECSSIGDYVVAGLPTALLDNCDASPKIQYPPSDIVTAGACVGENTIARTWTVKDASGNAETHVQNLTVKDTKAPTIANVPANVTIECGDAIPPVPASPVVAAADNCDSNPTLTFTSNTNPTTCASNSTIVRTWKATDACGNTATKTQTITITDTKAPQILACPKDTILNNQAGVCTANVLLVAPVVQDQGNCSVTTTPFSLDVTQPIVSATPGDFNVIVKTVILNFAVPINNTTIASGATINLDFSKLDGEQATEFFNIVGEDGVTLGKTTATATQCGNLMMPVPNLTDAKINAWGQDGTITIKLVPNVPASQTGNFAINDICTSSTVKGTLAFAQKTSAGIKYEYEIDGNGKVPVAPIANVTKTLDLGEHTITYYVSDCSNNTTTCSYKVTIIDNEKPKMVCPADITINTTSTTCDTKHILALPSNVRDNCGFGTEYYQLQPSPSSQSFLTFTYNPNLLEYFADDKEFIFTNVQAAVLPNNISLDITLKGDTDNSGEYFTIFGENNTLLGTTSTGVGNCTTFGTTSITITQTQFNAWAVDGEIHIKAVSNTSFPISAVGTSPGINPCTAITQNGAKDGTSKITAELRYILPDLNFYTEGATVIDLTTLTPISTVPEVTLNIGKTKVFYVLQDGSALNDTCSYTITVKDNTPPIAKCTSSKVFITPAGIAQTKLNPLDINKGSSDNCKIDTMWVTPNSISCNFQILLPVTLNVRDKAGNVSTCATNVKIEVETPKPTYSLGICGNDSLKLFANPPAVSVGNVVYTYQWTGPGSFTSNVQNPVIPNVTAANAGSYSVSVKGITDCVSTGVVQVPIDNQPNTPFISTSNLTPCLGDPVLLTTQAYTGTVVKYNWYKGIPPTGTLLATTTSAAYTPSLPPSGANRYYVKVEVDACQSNFSAPINVVVTSKPVATLTNNAIIEICEGEKLSFGAANTGATLSYLWTGPDGFTSTLQYPPVINSATPDNSGVYTLIVFNNDCASAPVTTTVNVKSRPAKPLISLSGSTCIGNRFTLNTNIQGADAYYWVAPNFTEYPTTKSKFDTLSSNIFAGVWSVYATKNGCKSDASEKITVTIAPTPILTPSSNTPVCEGSNIQLSVSMPAQSTVLWSGTNFTSTAQNPTTSATAGPHTYNVIVQTPDGCVANATTIVDVKKAPKITAITTNFPTTCVTGAQIFKLTPSMNPIDPGNYQYSWTGPNGFASSKTQPTLPTSTSADAGPYTLVVKDGAGCISLAKTEDVLITDKPATPIATAVKANLCEGDALTINATPYVGTNITYRWATPTGLVTTTIPSFNLPAAITNNSGMYSLIVEKDGCQSNPSGIVNVVVNPIPSAPIVNSNSPICANSPILLSTSFVAGATYQWTGPSGFNASVNNPTIVNGQEVNEGAYKVRILQNGCASPYSDEVYVVVYELPATPVASNSGAMCLTNTNATFVLSVAQSSATAGASYTWYNAATNQTVSGANTSLDYLVPNVSTPTFKEGVYSFYVVTNMNGCKSLPSVPTSVKFDTIPSQAAFAGSDAAVCNQAAITLSATNPSAGTGIWTQVVGTPTVISNPNNPATTVNGLSAGQNYSYRWTLSKGACQNYAYDDVSIQVGGTSQVANAGDSVKVCGVTAATIQAIAPTGNVTGRWTQSAVQASLGVSIASPNSATTNVTFPTGTNNYMFTWVLSSPGCTDYSTASVMVIVGDKGQKAFAGVDLKDCGEGIVLNATPPTNGNLGKWISVGTATVNNPTDAKSVVTNLKGGSNLFIWELSNKACGVFSKDTMKLTYEASPVAVEDLVSVPTSVVELIDLIDNDKIAGEYRITIIEEPKHGKITRTNDEGKVKYSPDPRYTGTDEFIYKICSVLCPDVCAQASVKLSIGNDAIDYNVPHIITPNGDGFNDAFVVKGIAEGKFPTAQIIIFTQWGDEVFRAQPYNNDWEGTYKGQQLPVGTYYYIIQFDEDHKEAGFLRLDR
jgi:gliding motility-associated-like protein